ncbi:MAG: D-aminoacyl-tRNA deacylase [Gemmatimonadota bacterium]|nr:D-aminoacyl-tRNA deacylase [Gemmatimonadota bacterium]
MRAVVQRVSRAAVRVDGETVGEIGAGLLVLVGFGEADGAEALGWLADKLWGLRVFRDDEDRMNLSAAAIDGELLIVSQFTLYGDVRKGRRPSFVAAAKPEVAEVLYDQLVEICRRSGPVRTGRFGAMMEVELVNDGPVTILIEREAPLA